MWKVNNFQESHNIVPCANINSKHLLDFGSYFLCSKFRKQNKNKIIDWYSANFTPVEDRHISLESKGLSFSLFSASGGRKYFDFNKERKYLAVNFSNQNTCTK